MAPHLRWRFSFLGMIIPAILAALTLSWTGVMMGMFVANDKSSAPSFSIEDAMLLPDNFKAWREPSAKVDPHARAAARGTLTPAVISDVQQFLTNVHYPRVMSLYTAAENEVSDENGNATETKKRVIEVSSKAMKEQKRLLDSKDFSYRDPLYENECVPMQPWQETSFPNCNLFHELDFYGKSLNDEFTFAASGGYNQIFLITNQGKPNDPDLAMKILEYDTTYSDRNYDRVRRDALILERLTHSPHVMSIYGFCGFDVLVPFAGGGTLTNMIRQWRRGQLKLTSLERLNIALEVSQGLADVHDIDGEGLSSVAHGDLKGQQYMIMDGKLQLGDFNRGRFLRRNSTEPTTACPYTIGVNDAAFRSPEEYQYVPQTSAIDVWALGSILFLILTGKEPWEEFDTKKAQQRIAKGELPEFDGKVLQNGDKANEILKQAIDMCYVYDPKKRATAVEVRTFLENAVANFKMHDPSKKLKRRSIAS
mmetsp:Transcript_29633/g.61513  ORF Transcript_29633/g.61513 Transcript_29633/m.61513 type:complete len:480 (+) Transcript_29633:74-1513(+)